MRRLSLALGVSVVFALGAGCFDFTGVQCDSEACPSGYFCDSSSRCRIDGEGDPDGGGSDAGSTDAGSTDGGQTDGGSTDAGQTDAGLTDAGLTDAGLTDAGLADAGCVATTEICNGADDDCDGLIDEPGPAVTLATGVAEFNVAALDGGYVAVMTTIDGGGVTGYIQFRAYDQDLNPTIPMTQVDGRPGRALGGTISTLGSTSLLSWVHLHPDGGESVLLAGVAPDGGTRFLTEVANAGLLDHAETPNATNLAQDRIAVLWMADARLYGRTFDPSGVADGGAISLTPLMPVDQVVVENTVAASPSGGFRFAYSWTSDSEAGLEFFETVSNLSSPSQRGSFFSFTGMSDPQLDLFGSTAGLSWEEGGAGHLSLDGGTPTSFAPVSTALDMAHVLQRPIAVFEQPPGTVVARDFTQPLAPDAGQVLVRGARLPSVAAGATSGTLAVAYRSDAGTIEGVLRCIPRSY